MSELILNLNFRIDELSKKREIYSNDFSLIKKYKHKNILKDCRKLRNRAELCSLLQRYHIKRKAWCGGLKLINNVQDMFLEINKGEVFVENINNYCNKHKQFVSEMDNSYRCMRTLKVTDDLIYKIKDHVCKTMLLWRELKLYVTPSTLLFEDHIVYQIEHIVGGLTDKNEDHIRRSHQDSKRSERIYCGLTNVQKSQIFQLKINDFMINPLVKLKSEQIKNEIKINVKREIKNETSRNIKRKK